MMPYAEAVQLQDLSPYVKSKLDSLQYGQKGEMAKHLGISLSQLSHYLTGTRPVPQKYIPGILAYFDEQLDIQISRVVHHGKTK
jgi:hypothetical protein